jgi:hypothetical protein
MGLLIIFLLFLFWINFVIIIELMLLHRVVPYQIALHDGRLIFAPQDNDQLIRLRPPPAIDAPSSPEYRPEDYEGQDEEDEGEYDMEDDEAAAAAAGEEQNAMEQDDEQQENDYDKQPRKK